MNVFIPVSSVMKTTGGLSVFGTLPLTGFLSKLASDWTEYRGGLKEAGHAGTVGSVPQILAESGMISIQAFIKDQNAQSKFQLGILRGFNLGIDTVHGQITEIIACDREGDDDGPRAVKLYKRATTMNANEVRSDLRRMMKDEIAAFKKEVFATTGTTTDSRGTVKPGQSRTGAQEDAMAVASAAEAFAEEFERAHTEVSEAEGNENLSPKEVARRAALIAARRLAQAGITDRSADSGSDPSLSPTSRAATAAADRTGSGTPISASARDMGEDLLRKILDPSRASVSGVAGLLKSDTGDGIDIFGKSFAASMDIRKAAGSDLDLSKRITEPDELTARLAKRATAGQRQYATASILSCPPDENPGTYDPMLSGGDFISDLRKRISERDRGGVPLSKLLH